MPGDPTIDAQDGAGACATGNDQWEVGSFRQAEERLKQAVEQYGRLAKEHPDVLEYRLGVVVCRLLELGWLN